MEIPLHPLRDGAGGGCKCSPCSGKWFSIPPSPGSTCQLRGLREEGNLSGSLKIHDGAPVVLFVWLPLGNRRGGVGKRGEAHQQRLQPNLTRLDSQHKSSARSATPAATHRAVRVKIPSASGILARSWERGDVSSHLGCLFVVSNFELISEKSGARLEEMTSCWCGSRNSSDEL